MGQQQVSELQYASLFNYNPDGIFTIDLHGRLSDVNSAAELLTGYSAGELLGLSFSSLLDPEESARLNELFKKLNNNLSCIREEFVLQHKYGVAREIQLTAFPIVTNHAIVGIQGIAKDITYIRHMKEIGEQHRRVSYMIAGGETLTAILESLTAMAEKRFRGMNCAIYLVDDSHEYLNTCIAPNMPRDYVEGVGNMKIGPTSGCCGLAAYLGAPVIVADFEQDPAWEGWRQFAQTHDILACCSLPIISSEGKVLGTTALYSSHPHSPSETDLRYMKVVALLAGVTIEKKQHDEKIRQLAFYDALTGLPNRQHFQMELKRAIQMNAQARKVGVLFIGIDRFKPINDTFGHSVGDVFLKKAAKRIQRGLGGKGLLARIGGDEFAVIVPNMKVDAEVVSIADKLVRSWKQRPIHIKGFETTVTVSVGAAVYPDSGKDEVTLLKNSGIAMNRAKDDGRSQIQMYAAYMNEQTFDKFVLASEFHRALMMNEFVLYYQPRHDIATNTISCVEALIRWKHPKRGMIPPLEFIPLAEETGFILTLGQWVVEEACKQAKEWRQLGIPPVRIAVNVSAIQFKQPQFLEKVKQTLQRHNLDANWLEIEITESALMQSEDSNIKILHELSQIGIQVSIDDFGTGYSSLNYLKKFKVNALKIDKSFVHDLPDDTITKSIIQLAHSLGLTTVAEGVELQEQFDFLKQSGCDQIQGYLIGKPAPPEHVVQFISNDSEIAFC